MNFFGIALRKPSMVDMAFCIFVSFVMWSIGFYLLDDIDNSIIMLFSGFLGSLMAAVGLKAYGKDTPTKTKVVSIVTIALVSLIGLMLLYSFGIIN